MKDIFPGHFKPIKKDVDNVWDDCIFVFDANIILNLYRYSDGTRKEFIKILKKINDRIWIPNRAAEEYLNNRLNVIESQEKSYDETLKIINNLKENLNNSRQHPFISSKLMGEVEAVFKKLDRELTSNKKSHTKRISEDDIKKEIGELFDGKTGLPYEKERLLEIIKEGEERYSEKIPPGYKDSDKSGGGSGVKDQSRKFGDLIIWNQILDKASEDDVDVVLIIDDKKEDWWERVGKRTAGARPELIEEFFRRTNKLIHIYQSERFLELSRERLGEKVSDEMLDEVRSLSNYFEKHTNENNLIKYYYGNIDSTHFPEADHISKLKKALMDQHRRLGNIEKEIDIKEFELGGIVFRLKEFEEKEHYELFSDNESSEMELKAILNIEEKTRERISQLRDIKKKISLNIMNIKDELDEWNETKR